VLASVRWNVKHAANAGPKIEVEVVAMKTLPEVIKKLEKHLADNTPLSGLELIQELIDALKDINARFESETPR
jgi:hypothetical protein